MIHKKNSFFCLKNVSTPAWQDDNSCSAGEEMGKIMQGKEFLGNGNG